MEEEKKNTVYEWINGAPVRSDETNYEWVMGAPYILHDSTVVADAFIPKVIMIN